MEENCVGKKTWPKTHGESFRQDIWRVFRRVFFISFVLPMNNWHLTYTSQIIFLTPKTKLTLFFQTLMIIFENLLSCFAPAEQFLTDYYFDTICTAVVYYVKNIDRRFKWWHFTFFLSNILDSKKSFAYYLTSNIWKYLNQIKWRNWICFFFAEKFSILSQPSSPIRKFSRKTFNASIATLRGFGLLVT